MVLVRWIDRRDQQDEFFRQLGRRLENSSFEVGFFSDQEAVYPNGRTTTEVARWNEYGTRTQPPRPFLRPTIDKNDNFRKEFRFAAKAIMHGAASIEEGIKYVGEHAVREIQMEIQRFNDPKNAQWTIEKKGFDDPLIETYLMQQTVKYRTRKK